MPKWDRTLGFLLTVVALASALITAGVAWGAHEQADKDTAAAVDKLATAVEDLSKRVADLERHLEDTHGAVFPHAPKGVKK